MAVVDVEQLTAGIFEVLDDELHDAVGKARTVEQGRQCLQGACAEVGAADRGLLRAGLGTA